jgi:hypothetical protein
VKKRGRSGGRSRSSGKAFRSSSKGSRPRKSSGGGFFGKKTRRKTSGVSGGPKVRPPDSGSKKPGAHGGQKSRDDFVKPSHDPGPKSVEQVAEGIDSGETWAEEGGGASVGGGCCSSISGFMTIVAIGVIIVVVIVLLKCTSCF